MGNEYTLFVVDDLESRVAGYDAGGNDFSVKPYKLAILKQKVEVLRRMAEEKQALQSQLDESDMLTSLVLSNLDEYAVLVKFLRSLNSCEAYSDVAEAMLKSFQLKGAVQFRLPGFEMTLNHEGEASPLEFVSLGMREVQEEIIKEIIQSRVDQLVSIFDFSAETENTLKELSVRLCKALEPKA
jgi:hypothetical protein